MNGGARTGLGRRMRRLETAVSALLGEDATARARLREAEGTSDVVADAEDRGNASDPGAAEPPTAASGHEATQAEVERAVRAVESEGHTDQERSGVEQNVH